MFFFSKLDLSKAYLQIKVDEECLKILTINTHIWLYKFNQLPFGIKVAPVIFQQVMGIMLTGLDFTVAYLDNILIISKKRHNRYSDQNSEQGLRLNSDVADEDCGQAPTGEGC